jgi:hypothetical protein
MRINNFTENIPIIKKHFGWEMAICQHPMYLLIDEDRGVPTVGERIPPWGAPTAKDYVKRVKRNLQSLDKYPDLKLNYEFSAVELESMITQFPNVYKKMKHAYRNGKLDFVNGNFSQAHLQILDSESNWRQFEYGLKIYKSLFGKKVKVYACQETGLHQQLPQMLKELGYDFIVAPLFPWAMEMIDGKLETTAFSNGIYPIQGDEFLWAQALDGSRLPYYIKVLEASLGVTQEQLNITEIQKDLYSSPPIWTHFPDMIEIAQKEYDDYKTLFDFILLEPALQKRIQKFPPRGTARIYSYWSYIEGVWAEELLRKNKQTQETVQLTEYLDCMGKLSGLKGNYNDEFQSIWHTILKYQHHDVYWIEVTDLRRKAIQHLDQAIRQCHQIMARIAGQLVNKTEEHITIFNGLAYPRKALLDLCLEYTSLPGNNFQSFGNRYIGMVDLPSGGYRSISIKKKTTTYSKQIPLPKVLNMQQYKVKFSSTGLMEQIYTREGTPLLTSQSYLGGEIKALVSDRWTDNRKAKFKFYNGKVADILVRFTSLATIPVKETYFFYHHLGYIKVEVEFDFNGNKVGYFHIDSTKINIHYPTSGKDEIYHDIPFGYIPAREERVLFAPNWVYCNGLVYINRGTVKHWVKEGVLGNVIAWGDHFAISRAGPGWRNPDYDLRLYGKQKIEYYVIPFGKFEGRRIHEKVEAITFPVFFTKGKGNHSHYSLKEKDICLTSITTQNNIHMARGFKFPSKKKSPFKNWEIFNIPLDKINKMKNK